MQQAGYRGTSISKVPRSGAGSSSNTILVNLDLFVVRATIGRDISPEDDDLIVLFRRNSKEVTSEPTQWRDDHVAYWNQHVGIQTSLLKNKNAAVDGSEFLRKDYEVVVVALPSHSAVALFSLDFADVVQSQRPGRPKAFRISPTKCRDLAAALELEVSWEYASAAPPTHSPPQPMPLSSGPPLTPTSSSQASSAPIYGGGMRRTGNSIVSTGTAGGSDDACGDCRTLRRRLERKELQITQLEGFLKESQKRIDSLVFENDELIIREQAETKNASKYRMLNLRLLQELEMAFQFCAQQMLQAQEQAKASGSAAPPPLFMFLPQFEFMERVKKFHFELEQLLGGEQTPRPPSLQDPAKIWETFDFRGEMETALERNMRLREQLEFLHRSLLYEMPEGQGEGGNIPLPIKRTVTNTSTNTGSEFSLHDADEPIDNSRGSPVRTITEQLNALERENFMLKAKLESATESLKTLQNPHSISDAAETTSSTSSSHGHGPLGGSNHDESLRFEFEQLQNEKANLLEELQATRSQLLAMQNDRPSQLSSLASDMPAPMPSSSPNHMADLLSSSGISGISSNGGVPPKIEEAAPAGGADFLNQIYMDIGKAKAELEDKVKHLTQELENAEEYNERLVEQLNIMRHEHRQMSIASEAKVISELAVEEHAQQLEILQKEMAQLNMALEDKSGQLRVQQQELQFMHQHLKEKTARVMELEDSQQSGDAELSTVKQALGQAEKRIMQLEIELEGAQHDLLELKKQLQQQQEQQQQVQVQAQHSVAKEKDDSQRDGEVAELSKQLKLARQEVMQLRYRSNNHENMNEKLEEALKEKKTLQVKLTALEGQLYEQRIRTISGTGFGMDSAGNDSTVEQLKEELEQKTAQLELCQRELKMLEHEFAVRNASKAVGAKSAGGDADLAELEAKVTTFAAEIARLCERNDEQAARIDAMDERVAMATQEKDELETILRDMMREMDALKLAPHDEGDSEEEGEMSPDMEELVPVAVTAMHNQPSKPEEKPSAPLRAVDRWQNAVRRNSAPRSPTSGQKSANSSFTTQASPVGSGAPVPKNKVAHLIKNFSSASPDASAPAKRRSTLSTSPSAARGNSESFRFRQGSAS